MIGVSVIASEPIASSGSVFEGTLYGTFAALTGTFEGTLRTPLLEGTFAALTGSFTGEIEQPPNLVATFPALTGAFTGTLVTQARLLADFPAWSGSFQGGIVGAPRLDGSFAALAGTFDATRTRQPVYFAPLTGSFVGSLVRGALTGYGRDDLVFTESAHLKPTYLARDYALFDEAPHLALSLLAEVTDAATFADLAVLFQGWRVEDALTLSEDVSLGLALALLAEDATVLSETVVPSFKVALQSSDRVAFRIRLPFSLTSGAVLGESESASGAFASDTYYHALVMNADTTGVTTYENFPFNGLASHRGKLYGITDTGLYELEGDDDDGDPIVAYVRTGDLNFGTSKDKNVPRAYLYTTQAGDLILRTIVSHHGQRRETYYELIERDASGDDTVRMARLGRGVRGVWWQFEVRNVDGADFSLAGAEVRPVVLTRRG